MKKLWSLDTKWACGGVITNENDIIIEGAPIFRKFIGKNVNWLGKIYKVVFVCDIKEESVEEDFF